MLDFLRDLWLKKFGGLPYEARYWMFEVEGTWHMMDVRDKDLYLIYSQRVGTA